MEINSRVVVMLRDVGVLRRRVVMVEFGQADGDEKDVLIFIFNFLFSNTC